jgi:hypothetical protein
MSRGQRRCSFPGTRLSSIMVLRPSVEEIRASERTTSYAKDLLLANTITTRSSLFVPATIL